MKFFWLQSLAAVCVSLLGAVQAPAQPLFGGAESIECTVAKCEIVVVGKLVEFDGKEQSDGRWRGAATIAVEETLKGEHRDRLHVQFLRPAAVLAGWKDRSGRLLLAAEGYPSAATGMIDLADHELQVLTAEFTLLRKPEEVIRVAKETVRRMPGVKRIESFSLMVPGEAVAGTRWERYYKTGGGLALKVPVDERLEKRAQEYVRSMSYPQRKEGVRALRYFKSDENLARLKSLLNDPDWAYLHRAEQNKGTEVRVYGVREEAYETLKYWGVRVEKPLTREEQWKPDRVRLAVLNNREVTDSDLRELARFENLQDLFLWNSDVTDEHLKELAGLTNLRDLYLAGTKVTDAGLKNLAGLTTLRYLDLKGTRVTDEGLKVLVEFKSLRKLELADTKVTAAGVAELHKLCPNLTIER